MNVTSIIARDRGAEHFAIKTFAAFHLDPERPGRAYPILPLTAETLEEAVNDAKTRCIHKEVLAIRESDEITGETRVHMFAVKQKSRPTYVWKDHRQVAVRDLYVEPVCVLPGDIFSPGSGACLTSGPVSGANQETNDDNRR